MGDPLRADRRHLIGTAIACAVCLALCQWIEWADRSWGALLAAIMLCPGTCAVIACASGVAAVRAERPRRARRLLVAVAIPVATAAANLAAMIAVDPHAC